MGGGRSEIQGSGACPLSIGPSEQVGRARGQPSWGPGCLECSVFFPQVRLPGYCHIHSSVHQSLGLPFPKFQANQTNRRLGP